MTDRNFKPETIMKTAKHLAICTIFLAIAFISTAFSTTVFASCPEGQQEACSYKNQETCGTQVEYICKDVTVCDSDGNCHVENQCGFESVYSCKVEQVYVCECAPSTPAPGGTDFCQMYGCSSCEVATRRHYCGNYNKCTGQWISGDWRTCTP